jgi:hypothetical protein
MTAEPSPTRPPRTRAQRRADRFRLVAFAAAVIGTLIGLGTLWLHLTNDPLSDVHAYYDAATRLNQGLPLYAQAASTNDSEFYRYPPLLAIAFRPLALLPFETAALIWEAVVLATLAGTILRLRPGRDGWLLFGMVAMPIGWSVSIGQAQVPMTFLMALGSPWAIALAANLKIFPAIVAIYWLGRRDWRSLGRFAVWMAVFAAVQLVLEPKGSLDFPSVFNLGNVGEVRNFSPYAVSPVLWVVLVVVGALIAFRLAPTRWGWAAAVVLSVVTTPRLLLYQLMTLVAALRAPDRARDEEPAPPPNAEPAPPPNADLAR